VPHLLDRIDVEPERLRKRRLGEPRADPDPQLAGREFEQCIAAAGVQMVQHLGNRSRRFGPAERGEPLDHGGYTQTAVVDLRRLIDPFGPQQRHRLGHVADIIPAHPEQDRVAPFLDQRPHHRRLHSGQVELPG
jgi:hypothetical protein